MATMPALSREYVAVSLTELNFDPQDLNLHRVAFTEAGTPPGDGDWLVAEVDGSQLKILIGPERGDSVTTEDLGLGDHQMWIEVSTAASDERVVRVAGTLTITTTGLTG